jgi:hypothetical protein
VRVPILIAAALLGACGIAACGGGGDDAAQSTAPPPAAPPVAPPPVAFTGFVGSQVAQGTAYDGAEPTPVEDVRFAFDDDATAFDPLFR